ncbi:hypothetical protein KO317_02980 [Candidatus Micrarchaeota archaeon]|nr:hypothetical protein [Candidatus Micrarchaeota archaeon]
MKININGMGFDEIFWIVNKLEKLNLSTRIDFFGNEITLSADSKEFEREFIELDKEKSEIIELDSIQFS